MGRVKKCRKCDEVLICAACGTRQTPESPDWEKMSIQLTSDQKEKAKLEADDLGISFNEYIRRKIEGPMDEESTDPG